MVRKSPRYVFCCIALGGLIGAQSCRADEILVSAAASLTDAFNEIGLAYTQANPQTKVRFNFASSGALQRQIEQGAPVDVFASAAPREMDSLQRAGRIRAETRADFAGNRLVLIASRRSGVKNWEELRLPSVRRVALSDPDSVPSGRYARETLTKRGLWDAVQAKAVFGENVRQTLTYVARGDAEAGVVFSTDALAEQGRIRVAQSAVSGKDHAPIVYPAAAIKNAPNPQAAARFVLFLQSPTAQRILARYGFATRRRQSGAPAKNRDALPTKKSGKTPASPR